LIFWKPLFSSAGGVIGFTKNSIGPSYSLKSFESSFRPFLSELLGT